MSGRRLAVVVSFGSDLSKREFDFGPGMGRKVIMSPG